jgi:hypothetical protein
MAVTVFTVSTGTGIITKDGQATWAGARDSATGTITVPTVATASAYSTYRNPVYDNGRSFFGFNTSALTSYATIVSATFDIYVTARSGTDAETLNVVQMTSGDPTSLVVGDYINAGATSAGSLAFGSASTSAYNNITLDATGLSWISKTGVTNLALRTSRDINNSAPTVDQPSGNNLTMGYAGGYANPATLTVTYTLPSSFFSMF